MLLVFWFAVWTAAVVAHRPWQEPDPRVRYLWWLSVPMFGLFLAFSPKTDGGEPNWPVTAYVSGMVLGVAWLVRQLDSPQRWYRRLVVASWSTASVLGLTVTLLMHHTEWFHPALVTPAERLYPGDPYAVRKFDPTCRLRGWRTLAKEIDQIRSELEREGIEPVLAGSSWSLPGEIAVYCCGRPTVYSVGLVMGDRHSQHDFWRPNPVADPEAFRGRTFVIVGGISPEARQAFERIDPPRAIVHCVNDRPISAWQVTIARGFRGFPSPPNRTSY
jgi:hypothetical protein